MIHTSPGLGHTSQMVGGELEGCRSVKMAPSRKHSTLPQEWEQRQQALAVLGSSRKMPSPSNITRQLQQA